MKTKRYITAVPGAAAMMVLILDSKTAVSAGAAGIDLCLRTLIPALFPFLVASSLLTGALMGQPIRFLAPFGKILGIPNGAESLLLVGFLGGYPVGADHVSRGYRLGALDRQNAERMLAFCSNAGPSFLFGIIGSQFEGKQIPWALWGIHATGAMIAGIMSSQGVEKAGSSLPYKECTIFGILRSSVSTMGIICGWVILFRVFIGFLNRWFLWALPVSVQVLISGILELSNGCSRLMEITSDGVRYLVAAVMLSLGGGCVIMQTISVCNGLSLRWYLTGKLMQCSISVLLCCATQFLFTPGQRLHFSALGVPAVVLVTGILGFALASQKKSSGNIALVDV